MKSKIHEYQKIIKKHVSKKFIIFLIFMPQLFYGQWVQQVSGTTENLNDIFCVTENLVFAVGDNGTILKTTNGGVNWIPLTSDTTQSLKKVQFANTNIGLILCGNGTIIKTINAGQNWNPIIFTNIKDFSVVNESIFYLTKLNGELFKTTNFGLTFQLINSNENLTNIQFLSENIAFESYVGLGIGGVNLRKTIDGGTTWNVIYNNITASYFIDENVGFIKTLNGISKTIDGGITFIQLGSNINGIGIINKIYSKNENVIWGVPINCLLNGSPCYSLRGEILNTSNFQLDIFLILRSIHFANQSIGYGISIDKIYKNSTGLLNNNFSKKYDSFKIYPNPSTNSVVISSNGIFENSYTIDVFNALGKNVYSKSYNLEKEVSIDIQNFSKGVYFLTVTAGDSKQTQKLIIN